jgi:hypothetical protein
MAKFYDSLTPKLREFIAAQHVFFVATAPPEGRLNLSPKGMNTLRVIDDNTIGYLDLTGSGNETSAHIHADGRLIFMFCSFDETPWILRLYGRGRVVQPGDPDWALLSTNFPSLPGTRQIILLQMESAQTSCGFSIPLMEFKGERQVLVEWAEKKGEDGVAEYRDKNNRVSIDGLPTGYRGSAEFGMRSAE